MDPEQDSYICKPPRTTACHEYQIYFAKKYLSRIYVFINLHLYYSVWCEISATLVSELQPPNLCFEWTC